MELAYSLGTKNTKLQQIQPRNASEYAISIPNILGIRHLKYCGFEQMLLKKYQQTEVFKQV